MRRFKCFTMKNELNPKDRNAENKSQKSIKHTEN